MYLWQCPQSIANCWTTTTNTSHSPTSRTSCVQFVKRRLGEWMEPIGSQQAASCLVSDGSVRLVAYACVLFSAGHLPAPIIYAHVSVYPWHLCWRKAEDWSSLLPGPLWLGSETPLTLQCCRLSSSPLPWLLDGNFSQP